MSTATLERKIGKSTNPFCDVSQKNQYYESFCYKARHFLDDRYDGIESDFHLLPMEEDDGIDALAFMISKKILAYEPAEVTFNELFECFLVIDKNGKTDTVVPPVWFISLMSVADYYKCRYHGMSIREFFFYCLNNHIGVPVEKYHWVFDGRTNEQKVFDLITSMAKPGDTIEYQPDWYISIVKPTTKHTPGRDSFSDFMFDLPKTISKDILIMLFNETYGEARKYDEILAGYNWIV